MSPAKGGRRGFTIMELMMVVLIISILASLVSVKLNDAMRKAKEGATLENLGALRSALSIYYADLATVYPSRLGSLTLESKYINSIPSNEVKGYHAGASTIREGSGLSAVDDSAGWAYNNDPDHSDFGKLMVNCTHTDTKSSVWSSY